jgi:hypothetical protein
VLESVFSETRPTRKRDTYKEEREAKQDKERSQTVMQLKYIFQVIPPGALVLAQPSV